MKKDFRHINDNTLELAPARYSKLDDYKLLVKHKLSLTVVITSILGYLIMSGGNYMLGDLLMLSLGGFLVTAAANAINEVLEKDYDALMRRTSIRPLAAGRMSTSEAVIFAGVSCLLGVTLLSVFNPITGILGMVSFVIYSFIYTPLKRISTISVAIGAIPGALPLLIGCTAYSGEITVLAIGLFSIQFLWQFPHFWSIGYLGFDDYYRAGYMLIPHEEGRPDRKLGLYAIMYTTLMFPVTVYLYTSGNISSVSMGVNLIFIGCFAYFAVMFNQKFDKESARRLMFSSFFFIPIYLLTCLFL